MPPVDGEYSFNITECPFNTDEIEIIDIELKMKIEAKKWQKFSLWNIVIWIENKVNKAAVLLHSSYDQVYCRDCKSIQIHCIILLTKILDMIFFIFVKKMFHVIQAELGAIFV